MPIRCSPSATQRRARSSTVKNGPTYSRAERRDRRVRARSRAEVARCRRRPLTSNRSASSATVRLSSARSASPGCGARRRRSGSTTSPRYSPPAQLIRQLRGRSARSMVIVIPSSQSRTRALPRPPAYFEPPRSVWVGSPASPASVRVSASTPATANRRTATINADNQSGITRASASPMQKGGADAVERERAGRAEHAGTDPRPFRLRRHLGLARSSSFGRAMENCSEARRIRSVVDSSVSSERSCAMSPLPRSLRTERHVRSAKSCERTPCSFRESCERNNASFTACDKRLTFGVSRVSSRSSSGKVRDR